MKKVMKSFLLILLATAILAAFAGCNQRGSSKETGSLTVDTVEIITTAYLDEPYDLTNVILLEEGVEYSATAVYSKVVRNEENNTYTITNEVLEVNDLCFTPKEAVETFVTITAKRGKETASKVICVPVAIRAEPLDELYHSNGRLGISDPGISKSVNIDPAYLKGDGSTTSLHITFNGMDPHPWGNTLMELSNAEAQKYFSDTVWENAILTFWIYNPNDEAIEFQLRIMDERAGTNLDWNEADGPHKQIAEPNQWTQMFFSLRKLGTTSRLTKNEYNMDTLNLKFRYGAYSTNQSYSFDFYLDGLDIVDASVYPDVDSKYILSNENLDQGWENMLMDIGWQGVYTEYDYENIQGEGSTCSLKAYFNSEKALINSFICLSPQEEGTFENLDMTGGTLSGYFKFENLEPRVTVDIINEGWQSSNQVAMQMKSVGGGWYYGTLDLESLQVGTGRNDNIIRIRLIFHGVSEKSTVYVDTLRFDYKYVHKVLESPSVDLINISLDIGPFYCNGKYSYVTSHLKGGNSVRSLKFTAPSDTKGRFTWDTKTAAQNGEISAVPNMTRGTMGAWFYFGDQVPEASLQVTSDNWMGSTEVFFVFTKNDGNGWYYGELHGSEIGFYENANAKAVIRWTLIVPAGYTVYIDNLNWKANTEQELIPVVTPKPSEPKVNFVAGEDQTIIIDNIDNLLTLSFDYKIDSGEKFNVALLPDWDNYYGYFELNTNGPVDPYEGITSEILEDGYVRVIFDISALTKMNGTPTPAITMLYIRGDWTDASGCIENIQYVVDSGEPGVPPVEHDFTIAAGNDLTIDLDATDELKSVSFEYKLESGTKFNVALMPNWDSYFGFFEFGPTGSVDAYEGVSYEVLANGNVSVTFDLTAITKVSGAPGKAIDFLYIRGEWTDANGYIDNIQYVVDSSEPEVPPVEHDFTIAAGNDLTIDLDATDELKSVSFEYKLESGTKFNVALMPNWDSYFGFFEFGPTGSVDAYEGVSCEVLANGNVSVTFDLTAITKVSGAPGKAIDFLYIRGEWTDANGYIDNIQYVVDSSEPEVPPVEHDFTIAAGNDLTIDLDATDELKSVSFEYKLESGTKFNVALMPNWDSYFGFFEFGPTGSVDAYEGVNCEVLANGNVSVTFDLTAITKVSGAPGKAIDFLYIRGEWTDANGYIDNIQYVVDSSEPEVPPVEHDFTIAAGNDLTIDLDATDELKSVSFEYKLESGTKFNVALMPNWDSYFGFFEFGPTGSVDAYEGVSCEVLANGNVSVTFDLTAITKVSGAPGKAIDFLYIRGEWTDANGYIDNIQYVVDSSEPEVPPVEHDFTIAAGNDLTIDLDATDELKSVSFEYKLESGTKFNVALMPNWDSYFGFFEFGPTGSVDAYEGVSCEVLANGNVSVTFDLTAITKVSGAPGKAIDFLYIRGEWTDANGYIDNIQYVVDSGEPEPDQIVEGAQITANNDSTIVLDNTKKLAKITFDYKLESGTKFNVALMPNWDNYYGFFEFDVNGTVDSYDGITCEKLENGYIRVSFEMEELQKINGVPSATIEFLYIRGEWTDANSEISNICLYWDNTPSLLSRALHNLAFVVSSKDWMEEILGEQIPDGQ